MNGTLTEAQLALLARDGRAVRWEKAEKAQAPKKAAESPKKAAKPAKKAAKPAKKSKKAAKPAKKSK